MKIAQITNDVTQNGVNWKFFYYTTLQLICNLMQTSQPKFANGRNYCKESLMWFSFWVKGVCPGPDLREGRVGSCSQAPTH